MTRRITLQQLKKYDVNQKILETLADAESRYLLFSTIKEEKAASELSAELNIPLSSVYKKLSALEDLALITVRSTIDRSNNKRYKLYRSLISAATIDITEPEAKLAITGIE